MRSGAESGRPFTLVVTDVHMPDMDGFQLAERIQTAWNSTKAVILLLASGEHLGDLARCREMGISAYLLKPVRRAELRAAVVTALAGHTLDVKHAKSDSVLTIDRPQNERHGQGLHILLAEDNIANQRVACAILEKAGHSVVVAETGKNAVMLLAEQSFDAATSVIREKERRTGAHTPSSL